MDNSEAQDPQLDFIYSDISALKAVSFKTFMRDCEKIKGNDDELWSLIDEEKKKVHVFLHEQYDNVMATYDPKVVKFKKKRQVIISDRAAKDLL
ncbi:hypothetical protein WJR50_30705 [Catalinimonas sp. 4WD22]|uniref:hypothetical protein n=1 Tax=Catalinimonas locisalis TaxID=3133978 RepID=UPI003101305F